MRKDLIINLNSINEETHEIDFYCNIYNSKSKISDRHTFININKQSIIFHNIDNTNTKNLNFLLEKIEQKDFFTRYKLDNHIEIFETLSFEKHFDMKYLNGDFDDIKYTSSKNEFATLEIKSSTNIIRLKVEKNYAFKNSQNKYIEIEFNQDNENKKFTYQLSDVGGILSTKSNSNISNNLFSRHDNNEIIASLSKEYIGVINEETIDTILIANDIEVKKLIDYKLFKVLDKSKYELIEHLNYLPKINNLSELIKFKCKIDHVITNSLLTIEELNSKKILNNSFKVNNKL